MNFKTIVFMTYIIGSVYMRQLPDQAAFDKLIIDTMKEARSIESANDQLIAMGQGPYPATIVKTKEIVSALTANTKDKSLKGLSLSKLCGLMDLIKDKSNVLVKDRPTLEPMREVLAELRIVVKSNVYEKIDELRSFIVYDACMVRAVSAYVYFLYLT